MEEVAKEETTQQQEDQGVITSLQDVAEREPEITQIEDSSKEPAENSSFILEIAIIATIAGQFIGTGNIASFPMNVLKFGGFWFVLSHSFLVLFMGLPITFFELLIGQITGKETISVYGTYCRAAKGIGVTLFMVSIVLLSFYINFDSDSPGIEVQFIINAFSSNDVNLLGCNNTWNSKDCVSLYESVQRCTINSQYRAYTKLGCTNDTTGKIFKDTLIEFSDFCNSPQGGFDFYHLLTSLFILLAPLCFLFFDIKWTFYFFGLLFLVYFVLYLIILTLIASMIEDYGKAFIFIWHRTYLGNLLSPKALDALISGVLWSLSINGMIAPIGSFLKPKDPTFRIIAVPVLLDLSVSLLSVGMIAGALSRLEKLSPASDYLYAPAFDGGQSLIMYSQLMVTYLKNFKWVAVFSFSKLLGLLTKFSFPVICLKAAFREHLQGNLAHRIIYLGGYAIFNISMTILTSYAPSYTVIREYYTVSMDNVCKRLLYFAGIQICISIYGEVDFRIDLDEIYEVPEDWRRFFSPVGPVMFFCWRKLVPTVLLLSQTFVLLEAMYTFRTSPLSSILPIAMVLVSPIWAIVCILKQAIRGEPISEVLGPSEDHPSYNRIHGKPMKDAKK